MSFRELLDMDFEAVRKDLETLRLASEELASAPLSEVDRGQSLVPPSGYASIKVTRDVYDRVRYVAALSGCKIGSLLAKAVAEYIVNHYDEIKKRHEEQRRIIEH